MSTLPERIMDYMSIKGDKSVLQFSKNSGVPYTTLIDVMKGNTKTLSAKNVVKMAEYVGISADKILNDDDDFVDECEKIDSKVDELFEKRKVLFDLSKKVRKEDIDMVTEIIKKFVDGEG